jgi:hypothetical protein
MDELGTFLEANTIDVLNSPIRACHWYIKNRFRQLDNKAALTRGLPIGYGEIESARRYIIQQRLKLSGAWWTPDNIGFDVGLMDYSSQ